MKITRQLFYFALSALIIVAVSCKTTYPTEKLLQGKWTPVKVESYKGEGSQNATKSSKSSSTAVKSSAVKDSTSRSAGGSDAGALSGSEKDVQLHRMMVVEERASLEVFTDKKMVLKNYNTKVAKAKYKLKNKGYQVSAKEITTGKKLTLDILSINDTSAVVVERFPFGDIKITYHKVRN